MSSTTPNRAAAPFHGLTPAEEAEIVAVFNEWADIDRSHRKLAHRGSWLGRFWADPSTVRRVLERSDLRFRAPKREGHSKKKPWPDWAEEKPNRIWIYDTTHWTTAKAATTVVSDVISRKWIAEITSADETSTEVQAVFNRALRLEGLDAMIDERNPHGIAWDPDSDEVPVLLVMSDNGPQMSSGSTKEFMALAWLATHYGRPGTPTAEPVSTGHANNASPTIATVHPEDPTMRAETSGRSDIKSDTRQCSVDTPALGRSR
jgi:putative transposase